MEDLTLRIDTLAYGGEAVARAEDGRAVFVTGGCPGDVVRARVLADKGRFLRAEVAEVLEPSPDRVAAPCPYFGRCGGCRWQHVAYRVQREAKRAAVADALRRLGHLETEVAETVPSGRPYHYRNRIELHPTLAEGRFKLGYVAADGSGVLPVDLCLLQPKALLKAPKALAGALAYLSKGTDLGVVRVGLKAAVNRRDVEVVLWTVPGPFPRGTVAKVLKDALASASVSRVLTRDVAARDVAGVEALAGKGRWRERLGGRTYGVSAPSFFQVNTGAAERLAELVMEAAEVDGSDRVLDLYAGVGTFTLPLAEVAGQVVAVESQGYAVRDLRRNLEDAMLDADVAPGDAAHVLPELGTFDVAVVDPPRAGLRPDALEALLGTRPRRVVYVSCDPATLARDARALSDAGFTLTGVTPVDLFPQTYHVETVARFER